MITESNSYTLQEGTVSDNPKVLNKNSTTYLEHGGHSTDSLPIEKEKANLKKQDGCFPCGGELVISDISYKINERKGFSCSKTEKQILNNINIVLKAGQVTALLGSSGSGKTSLLDVLAHKHKGEVTGRVFLKGAELDGKQFQRKCGYVIQLDNLTSMPNLTTHETLSYIAQLKFQEQSLSREEIQHKVRTVMSQMKIWHVRNVKVGGIIVKGISGGEKRRTCIASQLLQDPDVILLDEPTTGLDSFTAHGIIQALSDLARTKQKLVFLTIHQPRSDIFHMLDNIGILSSGKLVYFGKRADMVPYFAGIGYQCPTYSNPLDYAIDISSVDRRTIEEEYMTQERVNSLIEFYRTSQIHTAMLEDIKRSQDPDSVIAWSNMSLHEDSPNITNCCCQAFRTTVILLRRLYVNIAKDRPSFIVRTVTMIAFAIYLWVFFPSIGYDLTSIQDRTGIFYETTAVPPMVGVINAVALFPALKQQFKQESNDGLYGVGAFLAAYFIHIIPFHLFSSLFFSLWAYYGIGLQPGADKFFVFFAVVVYGQYLGEMMAVLLMGVFGNPAIAQSVSTLVVSIGVVLSSGLISATSSLLQPLQWLSYGQFIKFTSEIVVANEYHELQFECDFNDTVVPCIAFTGDTYLDLMFPNAVNNFSMNFGILTAHIAIFWIIGILVYKWVKRQH